MARDDVASFSSFSLSLWSWRSQAGHASLRAAAALLNDQIPRADEISIDARVLLFVLAASIVTGILAGVLPALRAGRTDLNDALKEGGRSEGAVGIRTRRLLIVCEVALSVVLLTGAGVMLRTLTALRSVDAGFDPHNVLTMQVVLPETRYTTPAQISGFFNTTLARLRALPGVQSAAAISSLPVQGGSVQPIVHEGSAELLPRDQPTVAVRQITPGYLRTLHVALLPWIHRDPFDRLLVAQAIVHGMTILTPDPMVARYPARTLW